MKDIKGQRFGRLMVLRPTGERKNGKTIWECQCDCGKITFVQEGNLKSGHTKSCGCARVLTRAKNYTNVLSGQRFGKLVALRPTGEQKDGRAVWACQCDCGEIIPVREGHLKSGHTKSCGCSRAQNLAKISAKDLSGQRFGMLIAQRPTDMRKHNEVVWECRCDCGKTAFATVSSLTNGKIESCGCGPKEIASKTYNRDLSGQRFGRLIALRPTEERRNGFVMWECRCDCGNITYVRSGSLKSGHKQSCGCLQKKSVLEIVK